MLDERIGSWLLDLYRGSREVPAEEFQSWAMGRLHKLLSFDSGIWVTVTSRAGQLQTHSVHLDNQPPEMMTSYAEFSATYGDRVAEAITSRPWVTADVRECYPDWTSHPIYQGHGRRYNIAHVISTASDMQPNGLQSGISCYRANIEQPFTEAERRLKEHLFLHIVEAATINQLLFLEMASDPDKGGLAVCDVRGLIHRASALFRELVAGQWPQWDGTRLPQALVAPLLTRREKAAIDCGRISIEAAPFADLVVLRARQCEPPDPLTPRQREIARLLARGMGYKEVAATLDLSPSTITNQANVIYSKLGVRNKAELARLLGQTR